MNPAQSIDDASWVEVVSTNVSRMRWFYGIVQVEFSSNGSVYQGECSEEQLEAAIRSGSVGSAVRAFGLRRIA